MGRHTNVLNLFYHIFLKLLQGVFLKNINPSSNFLDSRMQNPQDHHTQANIIQETREIIQNMTEEERFRKAKRHLMDALNHRVPRSDFETNTSTFFRYIYTIQTSARWDFILFLLSFAFMYIIVGEPTNRMHKNSPLNVSVVVIQILILTLYWLDILMEIYHKQSWKVHWKIKFSLVFQLKASVIILLTIDSIVYYSLYDSYPIRLFRILRAFLPYLYNHFSRRAFQSFIGVYQDIIVYLIFYFSIIFAFGIVGSQLIELPPGTQFDWFKNNYNDVGQTSFLLYILASFDSWPDYWTKAVDGSKWYYIFYVAFIFLNFFYFVTIPTSVMFNSFKKTRSTYTMIDEIHQQNSLLLCFLCLGETNLTIQSQTFHEFMLYAYRNKLRLIHQIKQLSFRLDENQDSEVFVSEFLNLCKQIQKQPDMYPPQFDDWQPYIKFRRFLKRKLYLKKVVNSEVFHSIVMLTVVANVAIVILSAFYKQLNSMMIEVLFVVIFLIELLMRMLGNGIQKFFTQGGNTLEAILAAICVILLCLTNVINQGTIIELLSLTRIMRIPILLNQVLISEYFKRFYYKSLLLRKLRVLFQDLYASVIVGMKMFPLFMTLYYILGIIGIEAYDETFLQQKTSPYSFYDQVANFRSFLLSQVVIVQSMVEAGWSMIIFDHAYRFGNTILVYLYFISIHILIDTTIFSLMKGMVADLYEAITLDFQSIDRQEARLIENQKFLKQKRAQITEIKQSIQLGLSIGYDSLKKKQIYESKLDKLMIQNLKYAYEKKHNKKSKNTKPKPIQSLAYTKSQEILISRDQVKSYPVFETPKSPDPFIVNEGYQRQLKAQNSEDEVGNESMSLDSEQSVQMKKSHIMQINDYIMDRIILRMNDISFKEKPEHPQFLIDFLTKKLTVAKQRIQKQGPFNPNFMTIKSPNAISFYTNVLESLLKIKKPENERKQEIIQAILNSRTDRSSTEEQNPSFLSNNQKTLKTLIIAPIIRNIMLSNISEQFINKFQIEYFSSVYGNSFRQINRSTLEPLIHHQSLMLYGLSRVLRYPQPDVYTFWNMIGNIQENISRTLLQPGSIFTFAFEVEELAGNWFVLELKDNMDVKVRFIKTGTWVYHKRMRYDEVHYAQDIFHCDDETLAERPEGQKILKQLYNSFETLGLSMFNEADFFDYDPAHHFYDLFTFLLNYERQSPESNKQKAPDMTKSKKVQKQGLMIKQNKINHTMPNEREMQKQNSETITQLKITKVMGVVLSRQNSREPGQQIKYPLSDIKKTALQQQLYRKKKKAFKFDQDDGETLDKLEELAEQESQRIIDYESLQFAYLLETVQSVRDIVICNIDNLVKQAEIILNTEFSKEEYKK